MKLLLIGGIPSSGSSLLVYLLSQTGQFFCLPETGLFTRGCLFNQAHEKPVNPLYEQVPWIDIKAKTLQSTGWDIYSEDFDQRPFSILNFLKNRFKLPDDTIIVEKTPENIFAFEHYLKADSSRKVIVTKRDIESTCFSLMKRKFSILEAIILWFSHAFEIWRLLQRYPGQVFLLDYNEICRSPKDCLFRIADFFQVKDIFSSADINNEVSSHAPNHQWLLRQSSWNLSNRYWSKEIDASPDHKIPSWLLGVEFDALIDSLAFKAPEEGLIKPRSLNMALQKKILELNPAAYHQYSAIKVQNKSSLFDNITAVYLPHLYRPDDGVLPNLNSIKIISS
jgi:hypothetical protein